MTVMKKLLAVATLIAGLAAPPPLAHATSGRVSFMQGPGSAGCAVFEIGNSTPQYHLWLEDPQFSANYSLLELAYANGWTITFTTANAPSFDTCTAPYVALIKVGTLH
jgi:hypothetical protein